MKPAEHGGLPLKRDLDKRHLYEDVMKDSVFFFCFFLRNNKPAFAGSANTG